MGPWQEQAKDNLAGYREVARAELVAAEKDRCSSPWPTGLDQIVGSRLSTPQSQ